MYLVWGGCTWSQGCLPGNVCPRGGGGQVFPGGGVPVVLTHAYENITLPQTSFAGSNKLLTAMLKVQYNKHSFAMRKFFCSSVVGIRIHKAGSLPPANEAAGG